MLHNRVFVGCYADNFSQSLQSVLRKTGQYLVQMLYLSLLWNSAPENFWIKSVM